MNKPFLAAAVAASLFTLSAPRWAHAQIYAPPVFSNQQMMSQMWTNQYGNMLALRNAQRGGGMSAADSQRARGERLIKSGRATMKFPMRPYPIRELLDSLPASERERNYAEYVVQSKLWQQEAARYGAKFGDMADMYALATVVAYEAYSGKRAPSAAFGYYVELTRRDYLTWAGYQGRSDTSKQEHYEDAMMRTTNALRMRRAGDIEGAKASAAKWMDTMWIGDTAGVLARVAGFGSGAPAAAPAPVAKTAKQDQSAATATEQSSPQDAQAAVRFAPAAAPVLPPMLVAQEKPEARDEARKFYDALLAAGQGKMRQLFKPSEQEAKQQSVAQAMTYAIVTFYTAAKTSSGSPSEAGWTPQNIAGLEKQFTTLLGSDTKFRASSAQQKQTLYEGAVLMATMIGYLNSEAQKSGDAKMQAKVREAASGALQNIVGVPAERVRLCDAGLQF